MKTYRPPTKMKKQVDYKRNPDGCKPAETAKTAGKKAI